MFGIKIFYFRSCDTLDFYNISIAVGLISFHIRNYWIMNLDKRKEFFEWERRTDGTLIFFCVRTGKYHEFVFLVSFELCSRMAFIIYDFMNKSYENFLKCSPIFLIFRAPTGEKIVVLSHKTHQIPKKIQLHWRRTNRMLSALINIQRVQHFPSVAHARSQLTITFFLQIHVFMGL